MPANATHEIKIPADLPGDAMLRNPQVVAIMAADNPDIWDDPDKKEPRTDYRLLGSGILIEPGIVLTASHVVPPRDVHHVRVFSFHGGIRPVAQVERSPNVGERVGALALLGVGWAIHGIEVLPWDDTGSARRTRPARVVGFAGRYRGLMEERRVQMRTRPTRRAGFAGLRYLSADPTESLRKVDSGSPVISAVGGIARVAGIYFGRDNARRPLMIPASGGDAWIKKATARIKRRRKSRDWGPYTDAVARQQSGILGIGESIVLKRPRNTGLEKVKRSVRANLAVAALVRGTGSDHAAKVDMMVSRGTDKFRRGPRGQFATARFQLAAGDSRDCRVRLEATMNACAYQLTWSTTPMR